MKRARATSGSDDGQAAKRRRSNSKGYSRSNSSRGSKSPRSGLGAAAWLARRQLAKAWVADHGPRDKAARRKAARQAAVRACLGPP